MVVRWSIGDRPQVLALRDELTSRDFDDPGTWWADQPDVVGGRDRLAGGTWCATRVHTGVTALVLNRPDKRFADVGAQSRGWLPLAGVAHEADWPTYARLDGMASFLLVLAGPDRLTSWVFDGRELSATEHGEGTHMFTSGGAEDGKAVRYLNAFTTAGYPDGWRAVVAAAGPADDPAALVVRHELDGQVYATVFGQLIEAEPGRLHLEYTRRPSAADTWQRFELPFVS